MRSVMDKPTSVYAAFEAFPRPKGASSHIAAMVRALTDWGGPAWLLCCGYGDMPARQVEGRLTIWRFKAYHPNMLRRAARFGDFVAERLDAAGDSLRLCVFRDPWGGLPILTAAPPDCATVFEVNALPSWELAYSYCGFSGNHALRAKVEDAERFCLAAADRVLTVSAVTREALAGLGVERERVDVLGNCAAENFFDARPEACPLPELREGRWFGYVGSLHPWQGVETVLEGLSMLGGDGDGDVGDARMLLVHNGRRAPLKRIRKLIRKRGLAERVWLHPPLASERLAPVLAALDFTLAPLAETARNTYQGCCPIKIVESMAAGTPVLASNLRAVRALVTHDVDGLLVPPDRPREWALAIRRALAENGLVERLSRSARTTARERFWRPAGAARLNTVFDCAVDAAAGSREGAGVAVAAAAGD
jgi:glycosyltransferase involved in cell wall biosynthesis